ncbi:hypothetical protein D0Z08_18430 [Nocardioides immobilis]|uniref:Uncharacterized protein n=1 Tax=Nocardioides immobilis TaxID=2049295 RepID=A0A417XYN4_9ACTN|nr:hypothetical protein [Nocardioides immobilis]RHW25490.1 hypothetical protein D0Z08_18430 [Nocardioides immobilis]
MPPPPVAPPAAAGGKPFDVTRLLAGNWTGSAGVALVMLATAGVLSTALGLMAKPEDFGIDNTLTGVMMILAATFGADAFLEGEFLGDDLEIDTFTSTYPLTVTIITFAVGVLAFRRMVRSYSSVVPALGDVLRVALFVALPLFVGSLVFRSDLDELGGGWIAEAGDEVSNGDSATWGTSAPSALFVSFGLVALVLAFACLARRDWWPGQSRPAAEWLAPAVQGVALMAVLLPLCGLIGLGLLMFGPDNDNDLHDTSTDETWAAIAVLAGGLGNGGQALLGLGSGAELGAGGEYEASGGLSDEDETDEEFHRLAWYAGDEGEEPALWAAPAILLAVLVGCAAWVASRSREVSHVARNLGIWCLLLLVAVPWLIRLANLHGAGSYDFDDEEAEFSGFVGLAGGEATFYTFLIAVAVSIVITWIRGGLSAAQLRALLGRFQANPGSAAPPPPPPSYPPPPPPPPYEGR